MNTKTLLLIMLLLIPAATALTITPASHDVILTQPINHTLTIHNDQDTNSTFTLTAEDEHVTNIPQTLTLAPQERKTITMQILPPTTPGEHHTGVRIEQQTSTRGATVVAASPAIKHRITITVPQEGKHIRTLLSTSALTPQMQAHLTTTVENIGTQHIDQATVTHVIYNPQQREIQTLTTQTTTIPSTQRKQFVATWTPPQSGKYTLQTTTRYDGQQHTQHHELTVGNLNLRVHQPQTTDFGRELLVQLPVESEWNEELTAHAQLELTQEGVAAGRVQTPTQVVFPQTPTLITGYITKQQLPPGEYTLRATIYYAHTHTTLTFPVTLYEENDQPTKSLWVEMIALALLALILITDVYMRLKKRRKT